MSVKGTTKKPTSGAKIDRGSPEKAGVASVERALAILTAFHSGDESLSLSELAHRTKLYKSTILRLLVSLEKFAFVSKSEVGRYVPGLALVRLGGLAQRTFDPRGQLMPTLRELTEATKESASFYVRQGDQRLCMLRVDSPRSIRDHIRAGDLLPIHIGAAGHVILRFDPPSKRSTFRGEVGDPLVVTLGERDPELAAIAGPIFSEGNVFMGALALSGPLNRFTRKSIPAMRKDLLLACIRLTRMLGGPTTVFGPLKD